MLNYPEQRCKMCGKDISHKRIDAKYCDNRCRMRYNRYKEKRNIIQDIINICTRIPHNTEQTPDRITKLRVKDYKTGNVKYFTVNELATFSQNRLKKIRKQKLIEEVTYQTTGRVI